MSEEKSEICTVPPDPRFPEQNVTTWCFSSYVDYKKCCRLLGEGNKCCEEFQKVYRAICPNEWVSRWENQLEMGTFPLDLPPKDNDCSSLK